jgi:hypothetical protein
MSERERKRESVCERERVENGRRFRVSGCGWTVEDG